MGINKGPGVARATAIEWSPKINTSNGFQSSRSWVQGVLGFEVRGLFCCLVRVVKSCGVALTTGESKRREPWSQGRTGRQQHLRCLLFYPQSGI